MSGSAIQNAKRVAFQGEPGAYANLAAFEALPGKQYVPSPTFDHAVDAVKRGEADLCIIPVENSLMGRIADIHHLLPEAGLHIVGEHFLRIQHQLLGIKGSKLADIKSVYSQGPALAQCLRVMREHNIKGVPWHDTAGSAKHIAELKDPTIAAIASRMAGELYGLEILKADVEDEHHNHTRFLIMSREPDDAVNDGRKIITTFVFRVKNIPAALYKAMGGFATNQVNMTKLESYQLGGSFNATQFYADIEGHPDDRLVKLALEELAFFTNKLTVLGIYPAHQFRDGMP
jgi:prephenate dehydratase